MQVHVAWQPAIQTLIVAYRGSADFQDWLRSVEFTPDGAKFLNSLVPGARVHSGEHLVMLKPLVGMKAT